MTLYTRYRHWEIFKMLENDLEDIARHINICEENFKTHSAKLSSLILLTCTQIETTLKKMIDNDENENNKKHKSNKESLEELYARFPKICNTQIKLPVWDLTFKPWAFLLGRSFPPPPWWSAYNSIKHDYITSASSGTLHYSLESLSALYVLLIFYEKHLTPHEGDFKYPSNVLDPNYFIAEQDGKELRSVGVFTGKKTINLKTLV